MTQLALALLVFLSSGAAFARDWKFDVTVDDKPLGTHVFTLADDGTRRKLHSEAHFSYKIMFVEVYRYDHVADEVWRGACLARLDSKTEERGEPMKVSAAQTITGFVVDGPKGRITLPRCVMSYPYWNPKMLEQTHLLNPADADWSPAKSTKVGRETIAVRGVKVEADRYHLDAGKAALDLWYSPAGDWLGLRSITPEGRVVDYRLK